MNPEFKTPVKESSTKNIITGRGKFNEIVGTAAFVDKTLLIKEVVTSGDAAILLTSPRRFGKSSNLDMLKTFLGIEVDEEGKEIKDKSQTKNYKLFEKLNIAKRDEDKEKPFIWQDHCGKHPVIFVDFLNAKGNSYDRILSKVKTALHHTFMQHKGLYKAFLKQEINDHNEIEGTNYPTQGKDIKFLEKIISSKKIELSNDVKKFKRFYDNDGQGITEEDVETGLQFLSEVLHNHFGKRVYVLIDEYDAPVHSAINRRLDEETVKKVNWLIDGILCAVLKSNDKYLERGVMTGISGMVRASGTSDLNNIFLYKFLDNHVYAPYYGFTLNEINSILDKLNLNEMREGLENWYDGYVVEAGRIAEVSNLHVFNPWSVLHYLKNGKLGNYWEESGAIKNIQEIFKARGIREIMDQLIQGKELQFAIETKLTLDDLQKLQALLNCTAKSPDQHSNLFFSYLFELGYLSRSENACYYRLPNEEIRSESAKRILDYYIGLNILSNTAISNAIQALEEMCYANDEVTSFKEALNELFKDIPLAKVSDPSQSGFQANEDFYHTIINSLAVRLVADRLLSKSVSADRATPPKHKKVGFGTEVTFYLPPKKKIAGRADVVLIKDNVGVIIELKHGGTASEALNQIQDKGYEAIFEHYTYIPKIKQIGINVSKNKVDIQCELKDSPYYQPSEKPLIDAVESISELDKPHNQCYLK